MYGKLEELAESVGLGISAYLGIVLRKHLIEHHMNTKFPKFHLLPDTNNNKVVSDTHCMIEGEKMTFREAAKKLGIPYKSLLKQLKNKIALQTIVAEWKMGK